MRLNHLFQCCWSRMFPDLKGKGKVITPVDVGLVAKQIELGSAYRCSSCSPYIQGYVAFAVLI